MRLRALAVGLLVTLASSSCSRLPFRRCFDMPIVDTAGPEGATSTVGSIVYVRHNVYRHGTDLPAAEIRVVSPEGGDDRRLAVGRDVSFSADGRTMAVVRFGRIHVSETLGEPQRTLEAARHADVELSPDGRWLLWWEMWETSLHLVDMATGGDQVVAAGPVTSADWSPDSRTFLYDDADVVRIGRVEGEPTEVVRPGRFPAWLAGGAIWYWSRVDGQHAVSADGSPLDAVLPRAMGDPDVSGDGAVVFTADRWVCGEMPPSSNATEIWVSGPTLDDPVRITDNPGYHRLDTDPAWSPDGRSIAFVRVQNRYVGAIAVVNADGSGLRVITEDHETTRDPIWVPVDL